MAEFEVPQAAVEAGTSAHEQWYLDNDGDPEAMYWPSHQAQTQAVLTAAAPYIAAAALRQAAPDLWDRFDEETDPEALQIIADALFLRQRAPGAPTDPADETWRGWERRAQGYLRLTGYQPQGGSGSR